MVKRDSDGPSTETSGQGRLKKQYGKWKKRATVEVRKKIKAEGKKVLLFKFLLAPILFFAIFIVLFLLLDHTTFLLLSGLMLVYFFPPLGKESVIPIGIASGLHPVAISLGVAYMDFIVALFLMWNYDFALYIPVLGPWIERFERRNKRVQDKRSWLKALSILGVVLFVMIPFQGSGGVGGTVVGRLMGLNRYAIFLSICAGAVIGCLLIAYAADLILDRLKVYGLYIIVGIIVFGVIYKVYDWWRCKKRDSRPSVQG